MHQPIDKFAASALVLATQAFITNNAQITTSTEAENLLNDSNNIWTVYETSRMLRSRHRESHKVDFGNDENTGG
jgi:hypothetical protein